MAIKSLLSILAIAALCTFSEAATCTLAQLKGTDSHPFSITSPPAGAAFQAGTAQIVSVDHPAGSLITSSSRVDIVGPTNAVLSTLILPFVGNVGLGIPVSLPQNLAAGSYVYRLTLNVSGGGSCTLDSNAFSVSALAQQCAPSTSQCTGATTRRTCNSNGQFDAEETCPVPQSCHQNGNTATCSISLPQSCIFGTTKCVTGEQAYQYCEYVGDGSLATFYKTKVSCPTGTVCQNDFYAPSIAGCAVSAAALCTQGQQRCSASGLAIETCNNNQWTSSQTCTGGQSCNVPVGSTTPICSLGTGQGNSCEAGTMRCVNSNYQQCSVQSPTGQWSWGTEQPCNTGTTCTYVLGGKYTQCN
jgi:hypothetical protein